MKWLLAIILASCACAGCATASPPPIAVEIRRSGDDGATVRFAEALEAAFRQSPEFIVGFDQGAGALIVQIPHLQARGIDGRVQTVFAVQFSGADSGVFASSSGSCWDGQLETCAARVLRDARNAARSRRR